MQKLVDRLRDPALAFHFVDGLAIIVAWNGAAEQQFLWATEEAVGRPIDRIVRPVSEAVYQKGIEHIQKYGWDLTGGLVLNRRGDQIEVKAVAQLVHGPDGRDYYLGVLRPAPFFPQFAGTVQNTTSGAARQVVQRTTYAIGARGDMPSDVTASAAVDYPKRIGRNIRLARDSADPPLSQQQLADLLKIDRPRLSDWERGRWEIRHEMLARIALITGTPGAPDIGWFYDRHETPE